MKTKTYFLVIILSLMMNSAFAQKNGQANSYYEKITEAISSLNSADDYQSYLEAGQQFQNIAEEEKSKWVPFYHAGYAYIQAALKLPAAKKTLILLDSAQRMVDKTIEFGGLGNSKIICLRGYLYYAQQFRTPNNNTNIIARKATQELDRARFLDDSNPRPYYVIGLVLDQLDPRIGGNKKSACKHFQNADERFKNFTPRSELSPNWGAQDNAAHLLKCNQK
ncbi:MULTISPECIES: hypothetical protein [unclassified Lentimicrobium]|uniref:hypothetical protein n=1 Tax=unclassified Lentimicrobium TaxID=2677434 RepID=UPI0015526BDE|nr:MULTISPECIES: hypothetical protein [unclassified Lentimicrobium]NPD46210.1 hypothetical protein [Lentimicrobium sp. S6]NPD86744.1 hypothetical protein [Lentimicrobium sp. L6]